MSESQIARSAAAMVCDDDKGGFPAQQQQPPGLTRLMEPTPDHGEDSFRGTGRLQGLRALITGGDSGIGRAVAIAYAREGADIATITSQKRRRTPTPSPSWWSTRGDDASPSPETSSPAKHASVSSRTP